MSSNEPLWKALSLLWAYTSCLCWQTAHQHLCSYVAFLDAQCSYHRSHVCENMRKGDRSRPLRISREVSLLFSFWGKMSGEFDNLRHKSPSRNETLASEGFFFHCCLCVPDSWTRKLCVIKGRGHLVRSWARPWWLQRVAPGLP